MRLARTGAAAFASVALISSCGGSAKNHAPAGATGAITVLSTSMPPSLDPGVAFGSRAMEVDWLAYTPLLTYAHARGVTGTQPIAGLATDLPTITNSGTTYSFMLLPGLAYANGAPVRASDFAWAVERAIKLGWPGARRYLLGRIVGARAFADGRARSISGISTDDATGQITIQLAAAYGQFENVLALPALAPVPRSTPWREERSSPPPGVGPYRIAHVVPGRSFSLLRNPRWEQMNVPGIPRGRLDIHVRVSPNLLGNVLAVLNGGADALDPSDQIPADMIGRVKTRAGDRYLTTGANASYVIRMDTASPPFSSELARDAVETALNRRSVERIAQGTVVFGCYLLPPPLAGHLGGSCGHTRDVALARSLVARSGLAGTRVTVSNQAGSEAAGIASYYVSLLDRIGFSASYGSVGPQSVIELLVPDLPNPVAAYEQWDPAAVDPRIAAQVRLLSVVPASHMTALASLWKALDQYTARKGYLPVLGYPTVSALVSSRVDPSSVILHPLAGIDWSWLNLN